MTIKRNFLFCVFSCFLCFSLPIHSHPFEAEEAGLTSYEPNLFGLRHDGDDKELFLDFKISLKFPIAKRLIQSKASKPKYSLIRNLCVNDFVNSCFPYVAFTGRFGQYIGTRDSSPVISKRFNPKIFFRFEQDSGHIDLEYAHESNGQRITSAESWQSVANDFEQNDDKRAYANDYISRGWDYWGVTVNKPWTFFLKSGEITINYKNFVGGLLQGDIEEYFEWEAPRTIIRRNQIHGLKAAFSFESNDLFKGRFLEDYRVLFAVETGTTDMFEHNTIYVDAMADVGDISLVFWYRNGYGADFAQYFKRTSSVGVSFEMSSF